MIKQFILDCIDQAFYFGFLEIKINLNFQLQCYTGKNMCVVYLFKVGYHKIKLLKIEKNYVFTNTLCLMYVLKTLRLVDLFIFTHSIKYAFTYIVFRIQTILK